MLSDNPPFSQTSGALERHWLRLHLEATWGIQLPAIPGPGSEISIVHSGSLPPWTLCVADLAEGRVHIWRTEPEPGERETWLARAAAALAQPPEAANLPGCSREIALTRVSAPRLPALVVTDPPAVVRQLRLPTDHALLEAFEPELSLYAADQARQPLIGVIVADRLLCFAHSSRRTTNACELGVNTLPEARRRGYALAATQRWTEAIAAEGLLPIYSLFSQNVASLRLAEAAGYRVFAHAVTLSPIPD